MFGSYEPFLEIFSSKKFSRVVVYCSVIKVPVALSQATALVFYQIRSALSRTFLFFCFAHPLPFRSVSSDSLYRLSHLQGVVNSFFHLFFSALPAPFVPLSCPRLFRLRVSGWPDLVRLFKAPSSATGAILSLQNGIVNVFSVFYLFQTIRTILTKSRSFII